MTAPAAPTIDVKAYDSRVIVRWLPVDTATDYNVYYADESESAGIEAQIDAALDIGDDGWFNYQFRPVGTWVSIYVTALNVGAEESDASDTLSVVLT